jgi:outer membrane protein OmpA-like peptidoglycan-associated protein
MRYRAGVSIALFVAASACSPKVARVVLVPDREGHVGVVSVTNPAGTSVIEKAGEGVTVASAGKAPSRPQPVPPAAIQQIWGDALAAEPPAPMVTTIYFATGSAAIDADGARTLDGAIAEITRRQSVDVSVDGHSDTAGDPEANRRLSLARAEAVRDRLVAAGVPAAAITLRYHGKGNLLVPTADNVSEPRNRRVEVVVR